MASDQDRFDTAYEAFRDLSAGLYDIDTRQYARGVTSEDALGVKLIDGQATLHCVLRTVSLKLPSCESCESCESYQTFKL